MKLRNNQIIFKTDVFSAFSMMVNGRYRWYACNPTLEDMMHYMETHPACTYISSHKGSGDTQFWKRNIEETIHQTLPHPKARIGEYHEIHRKNATKTEYHKDEKWIFYLWDIVKRTQVKRQ